VEAPHRLDRGLAPVLGLVGAPGVVHVNGVDPPREVEPLKEIGELVERQAGEPRRHVNLHFVL
jgi:hypothetical protein